LSAYAFTSPSGISFAAGARGAALRRFCAARWFHGLLGRVVSRSALPSLLALFFAGAAHAQDTGDGRDGALSVTMPSTVINFASGLASDAAAGATGVSVVDATGFKAGDTALVLASQWSAPGDRARAGTYELHRVLRVLGGALELDRPLDVGFTAAGSQAVRVPEYTSVTVAEGASLVAPAWDGAQGGVLALLVMGELNVDGALSADGAGFRGGFAHDRAMMSCLGQSGEGLAYGGFAASAVGPMQNDSGGGGASCNLSGGGGGANVGRGGHGGAELDFRTPNGGVGGDARTSTELTFGGGGGASDGDFGQSTSGGRGGGAIFARAGSLTGKGRISADGAGTGDGNTFGGAGGAGAGGAVILELDGEATCSVSARGGKGGNAARSGTGAGGGGGLVRVRAGHVVSCPSSVAAGAAGVIGGDPYEATPGAPGLIDLAETGPGSDAGRAPRTVAIGCGCGDVVLPQLALALLCLLRARRRWA
jgi:hypothetical protein